MYSRVYVEITNICNRSCSFCHGTSRAPKMMTPTEFRRVCEALVGVTEYLYLHVMGEPLTHPDLPQLIKCATDMGFKVAITTNGTLLERRRVELLESGIYKINISLHSTEDSSDDEYLSYISKCINFADESSSSGILTVLRLWNRGGKDMHNSDTLRLLEERFTEPWTRGARGARIRHKLHLEYGDLFGWPDASSVDLGEEVFCHGLGDHFGILSDGCVIPCCLDSDGVVALGNVFDTDICEILGSKRAVAIKEGFKNKRATEELCRRCPYARRFKI